VAWGILLVASVLGVLNHAVGAFAYAERDPEPLMFALFACLNLYATAVLLWPYRRGEMWACSSRGSKSSHSRSSTR
jgi:hypothetical protein